MLEHMSIERKQELCKLMSDNLSTLRAKANMTQDELADRLGFTRQTISAIENKKRDMQWSTFSAIALFLSKNDAVSYLMTAMGILEQDVKEVLFISPVCCEKRTVDNEMRG